LFLESNRRGEKSVALDFRSALTELTCFIHGVEGERQARWPLGVREGGAICAVCAELTA
jgi:hypothetical protein